ncbi:MAG TPA: choice-of-anchor D domain-containing protein [Thermoleophilaceae bacterium]|nr:choice-of-anchor D domain-containing protein [Thermoleophilaceae bacterium]
MEWWARDGRGLSFVSAGALVIALALALALAAPAGAVDTLYWADQGTNSIRYVPIDGSAPAAVLYNAAGSPDGIALDPSTGRIYWADESTDSVRSAPIEGGGAVTSLYTGQVFLDGLAVDPLDGLIYWANGDDEVRGAPLAGGGTVSDLYPTEFASRGVAADVPEDLLYWTIDFGEGGDIRRGPAAGGAATTLYNDEGPRFVAVDSADGGVWWSSFGGVRAGTTAGDPETTLYPDQGVTGVAADASDSRIYWGTDDSIRRAPIAGGGTVTTLTSTADTVAGIAVLRRPLNTVAPLVSPTEGPSGTVLDCSQGTWSIGVPGAFLYRAPRTFGYRWFRNGTEIAGATAATYTAPSPGTYTCEVTGTNQAGSTPAASSNEAIITDPDVILTPEQRDFGRRLVADDNPPRRTFTVENRGGREANITSLGLAGADATAFELVSTTCGATLAAGGACEVVVEFNPDTVGNKRARLELESDGGNDSSVLTGEAFRPDPPDPDPEPDPKANLKLDVAKTVVLHEPVVPTVCRARRGVKLRRCHVVLFTLGGKVLGSGTSSASAAQAGGSRRVPVRIQVNRRGRRMVAPALGGVKVKLRADGQFTDGRRRQDRNRSWLFAERHHLKPPLPGIFKPDQPVFLPSGRRFLKDIARRARQVDIVRCNGHAARLPKQFVDRAFAIALAIQRAHVACKFLRKRGMTAKFVMVGHANRIQRTDIPRTNPRSWPPDRRSGIVLRRL